MKLETFIQNILLATDYDIVTGGSVTFQLFVYPSKDGHIYVGGSTHELTFTLNIDHRKARSSS